MKTRQNNKSKLWLWNLQVPLFLLINYIPTSTIKLKSTFIKTIKNKSVKTNQGMKYIFLEHLPVSSTHMQHNFNLSNIKYLVYFRTFSLYVLIPLSPASIDIMRVLLCLIYFPLTRANRIPYSRELFLKEMNVVEI